MNIEYSEKALLDLKQWENQNPKIVPRIHKLISNIQESPYTGLGKPEPLKHELSYWPRRIDQKNRLIYFYNEATQTIRIKSCKGHYV